MALLRVKMPSLATSFLGMELKVGVSIISLFAILNKVAGVYGILAYFTAGTGDWSQLFMYLWSMLSIAGFVLGIKRINEENGPDALLYAHFFAFDHFFSTIFTALFAVMWYGYTPHDGRRVANSEAQKEMLDQGVAHSGMDAAAREAAAMVVWKGERAFSAVVILLGWFVKIYFIYCIYSFALHLRRGTLPRPKLYSTNPQHSSRASGSGYSHLRGASVATIDDGTSATLAETLWEDDESYMLDQGALKSPAAARGTGMIRTVSGGALPSQRDTPAVPESPFAKILGRLSGEFPR